MLSLMLALLRAVRIKQVHNPQSYLVSSARYYPKAKEEQPSPAGSLP